jgi:hypothetical protein
MCGLNEPFIGLTELFSGPQELDLQLATQCFTLTAVKESYDVFRNKRLHGAH